MRVLRVNNYGINSQQYSSIQKRTNLDCTVHSLIPCDTVSFTARKSDFSGVDGLVVAKYKPPVEKFKSNKDLQKWAEKEYQMTIDKDFAGRTDNSIAQRHHVLKEWRNYFQNENKEYSATERLLIVKGITKDLKPNNDNIPPILDKRILADTMFDIKTDLVNNPKLRIDFGKSYRLNLQKKYLKKIMDNPDKNFSNYTGWVKIPSKSEDSEHFKENVQKLKMFSHDTWCTKSGMAEPYLSKGNFYVYLEDGKIKLGVRFEGDNIHEIQGELNNNKIPIEYFDTFKKFMEENNFEMTSKASEEYDYAQEVKDLAEALKTELEPAKKAKDAAKIFKAFGIDSKEDEDGNLILDRYFISNKINFDDVGVDEASLFKKVSAIEGDAHFGLSKLKSFETLKSIGGNADFSFSKIKSLGSLENIDGNATFHYVFNLEDFGNLEDVGGDIEFYYCACKDLKNLKHIGGDLNLEYSAIDSLGDLEKIDGNAILRYADVKSLGNLEYIGGFADFTGTSKLNDYGKLTYIGGDIKTKKMEELEKTIIKNRNENTEETEEPIAEYDKHKSCIKTFITSLFKNR